MIYIPLFVTFLVDANSRSCIGEPYCIEREFQKRDDMGKNAEVETRKMTFVLLECGGQVWPVSNYVCVQNPRIFHWA